jgi:rhodanese-related sulfurtransferase
MPKTIDREDVQRLVEEGAQLIEVLPGEEYETEHLPGAMSVPLAELASRAHELDRARPVVTYCFDQQCDLSPRAAWRLEALGFHDVYDFDGGKQDWFAAGLLAEGTRARKDRIGARARRDVPTCRPEDLAAGVSARLSGDARAIVLNDARIVMGVLSSRAAAEADPGASVESVMREGPSTFRPNVGVAEMSAFMDEHDLKTSIVTTADGALVGLVHRSDLS